MCNFNIGRYKMKIMLNKGMVLTVICLFIGAGFVPSISGNLGSKTILIGMNNVEIDKIGTNLELLNIPNSKFGPLPWPSGTELVSIGSNLKSYEPSLAVDASGRVHVAWAEVPDGIPFKFQVLYSYKDSGSCTWSPTEIVSSVIYGLWEFDLPSLAVDASGTVHVVWSGDYLYNGAYNVYYKYRTPGTGGSWITNAEQVSQSGTGRYPSLAVEDDGTVHVLFRDTFDYFGNCGPDADYFYRKRSSGATGVWGSIEPVSTESDLSFYESSIAVDAFGNVHAVWADGTNQKPISGHYELDISYKKRDSGGWPTVTEVVSLDGVYQSNIHSRRPSIEAENLTGDVHIIWYDWDPDIGFNSDNNIYYRCKKSVTGVWDPIEIVSTERTYLVGEPSLALEEKGSGTVVHVAWHKYTDPSYSGWEVMYKSKISGNPWPLVTEMVSTETTYGGDPSLDVDLGGKVHVAWADAYDNVNDDLNSGIDSDIFYKTDCCDVLIQNIKGSGDTIKADLINNCPCDLSNINWKISWNYPSPGSTSGIVSTMSTGTISVTSSPIPPGSSIVGFRSILVTVEADCCSTPVTKTGWVLWINWMNWWQFTYILV
jgi:hypothetical protein